MLDFIHNLKLYDKLDLFWPNLLSILKNVQILSQSKLNTDHAESESSELFDVLGESAKTNLIVREFKKVMSRRDFLVQTNKQIIKEGCSSSHSSLCWTSKPDMICLNYNRYYFVLIDVVDRDAQYPKLDQNWQYSGLGCKLTGNLGWNRAILPKYQVSEFLSKNRKRFKYIIMSNCVF